MFSFVQDISATGLRMPDLGEEISETHFVKVGNILDKAVRFRGQPPDKSRRRVSLQYISLLMDLLNWRRVFTTHAFHLPQKVPKQPLVTYQFDRPIGRDCVSSPKVIHNARNASIAPKS
jgi:hypothetical protein